MSVTRSTNVFFGTDETTGVTIANNATNTGSEIDVLGDDSSEGWIRVFLIYTSTAAAGSMDVSIYGSSASGKAASGQPPLFASVVPINGTQEVQLGEMMCSRRMTGQLLNNAVGASLTNVTLKYELFKRA